MTHNKLNYLEIFHENGLRVTRQRQAVLDAICQANGHVTISQIIYHTRKLDNSIDQSTVYRSLELFEKLGIIVPGEKIKGEDSYEIIRESHHHHLICTNCGADIEIDNALANEFFHKLASQYGFSINMDHLIVLGNCGDCLN